MKKFTAILGAIVTTAVIVQSSGTALASTRAASPSPNRTYVLYPWTFGEWHRAYKPGGFWVNLGPDGPGGGSGPQNTRLRYIQWSAYSRYSAAGTGRLRVCQSSSGVCHLYGRHKFHLYRMRSHGTLHYFTRLYFYVVPSGTAHSWHWSFRAAEWEPN